MRAPRLILAVLIALAVSIGLYAQVSNLPTTPVTIATSYALTPISATAAINTQTTLTIPAPQSGWYNYVCFLSFHASEDASGTIQTQAVTTSTNFNSFALKFSLAATASINYHQDFYWGTPGAGCVKSAAPTTATTFVSPAAAANVAYTWGATYFQAP